MSSKVLLYYFSVTPVLLYYSTVWRILLPFTNTTVLLYYLSPRKAWLSEIYEKKRVRGWLGPGTGQASPGPPERVGFADINKTC